MSLPDRNAAIVAARLEGKSYGVIAGEFGVSKKTVSHVLARLGATNADAPKAGVVRLPRAKNTGGGRPAPSADTVGAALHAVARLGLSRAAEETGVGKTTLKRWRALAQD